MGMTGPLANGEWRMANALGVRAPVRSPHDKMGREG